MSNNDEVTINFNLAIDDIKSASSYCEQMFGKNSEICSEIFEYQAQIYLISKKYTEAAACFRKCAAALKLWYGLGHPMVASVFFKASEAQANENGM